MATLTCTPGSGFVTVALTDVTVPALVTITRDPSPGDITVRGTPVTVDAGGALVLTDVEHPFGVPVVYTATLRDPDSGAPIEQLTDTVPAIPLTGAGVVVSNPITGESVTADQHDQTDERSPFRGYAFDLSGVPRPLVVSDVAGGWSWTMHLRTDDREERAALDALLRAGTPVLVRVPAACDLRQGWVTVTDDIRVQRFAVPASDARRVWSVPVTETDPPDSTVESVAVTLADLAEWEPTDLATLATRAPSLLALSLAVVADA